MKFHAKARIADGNKVVTDTEHLGKLASLQLGSKGAQGLWTGLDECLQKMVLGEEAVFLIPSQLAFGAEGLAKRLVNPNEEAGANELETRVPFGVSFCHVPPDTDIVVEVALLNVYRDSQWHQRKPCKKPLKFGSWGM